MHNVELPAEDYEEFAAQREKNLISIDHALPEYVRLTSPGRAGILVRVTLRGGIAYTDLTVYAVEYLIKRT